MDLRQYLQAVRKFWWVILIPTVLGGALGVFSVSRAEPTYQGSVTFFVRTGDESSANNLAAGDQFATRRVNTYVAMVSSDRLAKMILAETDLDLDVKDVSSMLAATGDVNTVLLTATATSSSRATAEAVSDAIATQFVALVSEIDNSGDGAASVSLEVVSGPTVTEVPTRPTVSIALRMILGLALGLALAVLLELRDTSVRNDEQLELVHAGPLLARIPFDRRIRDAPLVIEDDTHSIRAEAFRQLRTNLQFIDVERPIQVLVVTSSVASEGKSALSANLALAMVAANRRVLVIEADFRRPRLADYFGLERAVGLTDVLAGRVDVEDVLQPWGTDGLVILPSGQLPPNPSELLGSEAMARLLERFRTGFDMIIIDTPPLLPVTDAAVVATRADGALLVVRAGKTTRHQVSLSIRSLEAVGAKVLGSVLSMVPTNKASGYAAYRYESDDPSKSSKSSPSKSSKSSKSKTTSSSPPDYSDWSDSAPASADTPKAAPVSKTAPTPKTAPVPTSSKSARSRQSGV